MNSSIIDFESRGWACGFSDPHGAGDSFSVIDMGMDWGSGAGESTATGRGDGMYSDGGCGNDLGFGLGSGSRDNYTSSYGNAVWESMRGGVLGAGYANLTGDG